MLKKISDILFTKWGVYFVTLFVHLLTIPLYNLPLIGDEINPLSFGFMLRGDIITNMDSCFFICPLLC